MGDTLGAINTLLAKARHSSASAEASEAFGGGLRLFLNTLTYGWAWNQRQDRQRIEVQRSVRPVKGQLEASQQLVRAGEALAAWKELDGVQDAYRKIVESGATLGAVETGIA